MRSIKILACCTLLLFSEAASAQTMWKYFSPDDFAARRKKVMEKIGDGVAVLLGRNLPNRIQNSGRIIISITSPV
ncbi:MAG: hypothetical protein IPP96_08110 [Chitinophagaceae bacterium]|nr:hypothetical protein [Chitinophagaceae bacterium]